MPLKQLVMMLLKQLPMLLVLGFSLPSTHTHTKGRKSADKRTCRSDDTARARAKEQENQRTKERQRERVHTHAQTESQTHLADATE
jgi:hypothetical protein